MRRSYCGTVPIGLFLFVLSISAGQAQRADCNLRLYVRVYNHARLPLDILAHAQQQAASIYKREGVEITWLECPVSPAEFDDFPACTALRGGPIVLQLNLLSREKWEKLAFPDDSFGFALPAVESGFPYYVNIAAHRLGALADSSLADPAAILGCILAHEIGHLLLGVGSHSPKGIMTANWNGDTLLLADQGRLRFTPKQGRRLRRHVERRCNG